MPQNNYTCLAILCLLLFCGCKKEDRSALVYENFDGQCKTANTVKIPRSIAKYFLFKQGCYWIYENKANGVLDSIWISKAVFQVFSAYSPPRFNKKICHENVRMFYQSSQFQPHPWYLNSLIQYSPYAPNNDTTFDIMDNPYTNLSFTKVIAIGDSVIEANDNVLAYLDFIEVNNTQFIDVLRIYYTQQPYDILRDAWYAADIGLVKFIRLDGSVWELKRYKIIQ